MNFTFPPGSRPLDRFTIRRGIGMGGFGEVYFAVSDAGKEVALKRIQRNLDVEVRGVSHCLNLKHPNLVSLYDICHDSDDQAWVVMEYVSGKNLRQILDAAPHGLPEDEARRWFASIAAGVHHLHSAGLVHRDIKPGNVFDDLGVVKVGDYGLSKFISASHRSGHTESVGTFHYMAPEIGRGQYGREIDVYASGVLLYELLTGEVPFDGESCHEIIVKHLTATPDLSLVPSPYKEVIGQSLKKDPAARQRSMAEMAEQLGMSIDNTNPTTVVYSTTAQNSASFEAPINAVLADGTDQIPTAEYANHTDGPRPIPAAGPVYPSHDNSEPLARAVRNSLADLSRFWHAFDQSPGAKFLIAVVSGFVLLVNTHWLLPLMSFLAIFYVPYYVIRQMVLSVRQQPSYAQAHRIATKHNAYPPPVTPAQWREQVRGQLKGKPSLHRAAELSTSWVATSFVVTSLAVIAGVIGLRNAEVDAVAVAPYGAIGVTILFASLLLLGLGKLWERNEGQGVSRRLCLAGVGAGVGAVAFGMNRFLLQPMDIGLGRSFDSSHLPQAFYDGGTPNAAALMAHFALLFAALRWWKPIDPLRRKRLSLWAVAVALVGEWCVQQFLPIPQPTGYLVAGGVAIAVQMSAGWINPKSPPKELTSGAMLADNTNQTGSQA